MTTITLTDRPTSPQNLNSVLHDLALQTGGIAVDQNEYTTGLDRVYDIRGFTNLHIEITNFGSTENGLTYTIQKARKSFDLVSELVDNDFDVDVKADTNVSAGVLANGTVTLATVLATDTCTINGLIYLAVSGAATEGEFDIDGGTDTLDAIELRDAINEDTRVGTLNDVIATASAAVVTVKSTVVGTASNAITLTTQDATMTVSGALFTGGTEPADSISDIIDISPESTAIRIRIKRETSGQDTILQGITSLQ